MAESEKFMRYKRNDRFEFPRMLLRMIREDYKGMKANPNLIRLYRQELKKVQGEDPLRISLMNGAVRIRWGREWDEGPTEYRILKGQWTDEEIMEAIEEEWETIRSPYDCTGRMFTADIHAAQTPVGVVWIHRRGVDV